MDLDTSVSKLPFVGPVYVKKLLKLEIETIKDLFYHIPSKYLDFRQSATISSLQAGDIVNIEGTITSFKNQYTKGGKKLQLATVEDNTGKVEVIWFNQPFLTRVLHDGQKISVSGKVDWFARRLAFMSPVYEVVDSGEAIHTKGLIPVYPETAGVSSKWLRRRILDAFKNTQIEEFLPSEILEKYNLVEYKKAIELVHYPKTPDDYDKGKRRLAFNEFLFHHLKNLARKSDWSENKVNHKLEIDQNRVNDFIKSFPYELTSSQKEVTAEILKDLESAIPMNRLLQGDVGSGKTVVAAIAAYAALINKHKVILMAPTQILAEQHYQTFIKLFEKFNTKIALITGNQKIIPENTDIYLGTHALIHTKVNLKEVALVIIDEQHRFGVEQRQHLVNKIGSKKIAPHVLTMTATPIPRTMALTFYGDLSLSVLTELPSGRKPITTWVVPPEKRENAYHWIDEQITKDQVQAYVICPLIDESEKLTEVKSAIKEGEVIKKLLPKRKVEILHGKQTGKLKTEILAKFKDKKIDILVATPVVEVGIDFPNATIIAIEGGERFGLSQLHQLRGRVGRGEKKSYCLVFSDTKSPVSIARLNALTKSNSGFELSEIDFKMRGPGEIFGTKQHGVPYLRVASWHDTDLIKESRTVAEDISQNPSKFRLELDSKPW